MSLSGWQCVGIVVVVAVFAAALLAASPQNAAENRMEPIKWSGSK